MTDLSHFAITKRWPPADPGVIQLYSYPTPNGVKVSIALEELGLAYEPHLVTLSDTDVKSEAFLSLNPNNKIPAIVDPQGPGGQPFGLFESGAILIYLAEKTGRLLGETPAQKYEAIQWVMFQMGGVGPMFGQLGFFVKFAGASDRGPPPARALYRRGQATARGGRPAAGGSGLDRGALYDRRYRPCAVAELPRVLWGARACRMVRFAQCPGLCGPLLCPACRRQGPFDPADGRLSPGVGWV
jgi:glutathione S-transferase